MRSPTTIIFPSSWIAISLIEASNHLLASNNVLKLYTNNPVNISAGVNFIKFIENNFVDGHRYINKVCKFKLKVVKDDSYCIALAIEGAMLSSEDLASKIDILGVSGTSHISFIIGGSLGLADEVLKRADYKLSFSKMTFPHQLIRVFLLEQIFRAFKISNNEKYHH